MPIDRPEPTARYAERAGLATRVVYSLFPEKLLVRVERWFSVAEFYVDVRSFAEGHGDVRESFSTRRGWLAGPAIAALCGGVIYVFWQHCPSPQATKEATIVLGALAAAALAVTLAKFLLPKKIRTIGAPELGVTLAFRLRPERMAEIEAFIRALMAERERMFREGPGTPLGPKEVLNSAQRIMKLKGLLDKELITPEQFERFKEFALKT